MANQGFGHMSITAVRQIMRIEDKMTYKQIAKLTACSVRTAWESVNCSSYRGTRPYSQREYGELIDNRIWAHDIKRAGHWVTKPVIG